MVLLIALDEIPDVCSSCFYVMLTSLASRSRNQGVSNWTIPPRNFQKHVELLAQLNISAGCGPAC